MIYTVSAGPQSYGQINFDLLNHMSSFVVVSVSNDSLLFFYYGLLNSIVSQQRRRTKISLTQARLELLSSHGKLVNNILIPGKLPLNFLVNLILNLWLQTIVSEEP